MLIREPAVAGMFYPRDPGQCLHDLKTCLAKAADLPAETEPQCDRVIGGVVPHAGWSCSGAVASRVFDQISRRHQPDAIVVFGAIHVPHVGGPAVFPSGAWETPLGLAQIDARLIERLCGQTGLLESDAHAHEREHSIEVEVPFMQHLMPGACLVPIMVPVSEKAVTLGAAVGRACKTFGVDAVFLASTDLTHYGPSYAFTPQGVGAAALQWAKEVNDRRMIDLVLSMRESAVVEEAVTNKNACGPGAVAATLAACKAYGAARATLLEHTTSFDVLSAMGHEPMRDAVGYASIILHN